MCSDVEPDEVGGLGSGATAVDERRQEGRHFRVGQAPLALRSVVLIKPGLRSSRNFQYQSVLERFNVARNFTIHSITH